MTFELPIFGSIPEFNREFRSEVWLVAAREICARHHLPQTDLRRVYNAENVVIEVGSAFVIKIYQPLRDNFERESSALKIVNGRLSIGTPEILHTGEIQGWPYNVMTRIRGRVLREVWQDLDQDARNVIVGQVGTLSRRLHELPEPLFTTALDRNWPQFLRTQAETTVERQMACDPNPEWIEGLPSYLNRHAPELWTQSPEVILHGDIHVGNLLIEETINGWKVSGLIDFGDSLYGMREYEFVAPGVLMAQGNRELQRTLLLEYGYNDSDLNSDLRSRLMTLTILYECSNLRKYADRLSPEAAHLTLSELERAIWKFADD